MAGEDPFRSLNRYPPPGVDARAPNIARVYDAFLGGKDNFAADRQVVDSVLQVTPDAPAIARANRDFLRRAVRHLVGEARLTQLLDIGSGLPTAGNVHEIAHEINPSVHTVYVATTRWFTCTGSSAGRCGDHRGGDRDLRRPMEIVDHPEVRKFLDFSQPVGLLLTAVMHHVDDKDDPDAIMARLRDAVPRGSYLVISSFARPGPEHPAEEELVEEIERICTTSSGPGTGGKPTRCGAGSATGPWSNPAWPR